ncbi:MAG: hypothetical protein UX88_C0003G0011 [Candidatus Woesebacteria bacterium GW2011_GWC2_47_16]|uniref:Uncharacterized protein n=8 Tax=Candidatus Woeseibacteriota TaxID=1752722 RepID=A0A0G1TR04_9BACT|nr:MAG: hypothetical protein UX03_C0004G0010 [Candidatus Woesebacteria bacterium GW2011_GWE1_45_18]KKU25007.1 MAG: hypothetical protein UX34_C0005G0011 [Candidatus Woesebacteria bacterium GW2011_GWF1_46_13]KKU47815.1 MAG: hypothetical protein UX67_C0028G0008 [Candidatus Woesebacteria bacterium GW2011_GWF2_46_8]KKU65282.1 MAG: hypothetical protein UX88_C0003G0011 [Candidatus Woesebacteria bacterium GW2011_GWC2_47_16]KKU70881.1 MAG: hypothetical protein UX95_C0011G0013 [Candidatus Woesebacteria b
MIEKLSLPISVGITFDHTKRKVIPKWILWEERLYAVERIGLHHTYKEGRTLFHVFSVAAKALFFRLVLNTETLSWRLEEISDGLPD